MINKINSFKSSYNPSFKGNVRIGKDEKNEDNIVADIMSCPKNSRLRTAAGLQYIKVNSENFIKPYCDLTIDFHSLPFYNIKNETQDTVYIVNVYDDNNEEEGITAEQTFRDCKMNENIPVEVLDKYFEDILNAVIEKWGV